MNRGRRTPSVAVEQATVATDITSAQTICVDTRRAAEILGGVSQWTVRAWIANADVAVVKLPGVRRGETSRRVLIAIDDLKAFVLRHREVADV